MSLIWIVFSAFILLMLLGTAIELHRQQRHVQRTLAGLQAGFHARAAHLANISPDQPPPALKRWQDITDLLTHEANQHQAVVSTTDPDHYAIIANQIARSRPAYNTAAARYNEKLQRPAGRVIAKALKLKSYPYYEGEEEAQPHRPAPASETDDATPA